MGFEKLIEKRLNLVDQCKGILDRAEKEGRAVTSEEEEQLERMYGEIDQIRETIDASQRLQKIESYLDEVREVAEKPSPEGANVAAGRGVFPGEVDGRGRNEVISQEQYRAAFDRFLRKGESRLDAESRAALQEGTDSEGGYAVPDVFLRRVIEVLEEGNFMRQYATVVPVGSNLVKIPSISAHGAAAIISEEGAYAENADTFAQTAITIYKIGRIQKVSEELLEDAVFDLGSYLSAEMARSIAQAEETYFVAGSGTGQPSGVVTGASAGVTFSSATAITSDELIDLYHALGRPYRGRAVWVMKDSTIQLVRKLKDGNSQYLWQPGMTAGEPDRLLGRPLIQSADMPAATTGNKSVIFGDLSFYYICERRGFSLQRLVELYAGTGQVGFRGYVRSGGALTLSEAVVYGVQA